MYENFDDLAPKKSLFSNTWQIPFLGMSIWELGLLILAVWFVRTHIFQLFRVYGPSMCPTINFLDETCQNKSGELVFVNQFRYSFLETPKRDEIVVFRSPVDGVHVIKRIIGVGGDVIEIKNGKVYRNDENGDLKLLDEPYLSPENAGNTRTFGKTVFRVPENEFFLLGDNRNRSQDGRHCYRKQGCSPDGHAFLPKSSILGRAEVVLYPFSQFRRLESDLK